MEENEKTEVTEQEEKYDYSIEFAMNEKHAFERTMISYRTMLLLWIIATLFSSLSLIIDVVRHRITLLSFYIMVVLIAVYFLFFAYNYFKRKKRYSLEKFIEGGIPIRHVISLGERISTRIATDTNVRNFDYSGIVRLYKTDNIYFLMFKRNVYFPIPKEIIPEGGEKEFEEYIIRKAKNVRIKKFIPFKLHRYLCYLFMFISVACSATYATLLIIFS